jgi:hypothetical protein
MALRFARLRRTVHRDSSPACLERGDVGLDGRRTGSTKIETKRAFRGACRIGVAACLAFGLTWFVWYGTVGRRARTAEDARALAARCDIHTPCVHFQTDSLRVVAIHALGVRSAMTFLRIVSTGDEKVNTKETVDIEACPDKTIFRNRYTTVTVEYQSLETWPSGRTQYATFRDKSAVCVQHALEDFDIKFTCSS